MRISRENVVARLKENDYDVLVIGGGITGACTARDAALRGFKTACVEKNDWAFGTSSRSSKLIHGGLRYLEMYDFHLVFEAQRERRQLLLNAPHLVWPQAFTFPIYEGDRNGIIMIGLGLWLYDILALFRNVKNHRIYLKEKGLKIESGLDEERLRAVGVFYDCSTDDARLTLVHVLSAIEAGADCANYVEVKRLHKEKGRITGAVVRNNITGEEFDIAAKVTVNASGAWGDELCRLDEPDIPPKLQLTKGAHIVVPRSRAYTKNALPIVSPTDERLMFVVPRGDFALIGTTDTFYEEDLDNPFATKEDVEYILEAANHALPRAKLDTSDIVSTYAGLRPLVMMEGGEDVAASKISREHRIYEGRSGLLTISGGKLTTGRSMAEEIVNLVALKLLKDHGVRAKTGCRTKNNPIHGAPSIDTEARIRALSTKFKLDGDVLRNLFKHGTDAFSILEMIDEDPSLGERLSEDIPHIRAQVKFSVTDEMAQTLDDFMVRRTEIFYTAPRQGLGVAAEVASLMGRELGWGEDEVNRQVDRYRKTVELSRKYADR